MRADMTRGKVILKFRTIIISFFLVMGLALISSPASAQTCDDDHFSDCTTECPHLACDGLNVGDACSSQPDPWTAAVPGVCHGGDALSVGDSCPSGECLCITAFDTNTSEPTAGCPCISLLDWQQTWQAAAVVAGSPDFILLDPNISTSGCLDCEANRPSWVANGRITYGSGGECIEAIHDQTLEVLGLAGTLLTSGTFDDAEGAAVGLGINSQIGCEAEILALSSGSYLQAYVDEFCPDDQLDVTLQSDDPTACYCQGDPNCFCQWDSGGSPPYWFCLVDVINETEIMSESQIAACEQLITDCDVDSDGDLFPDCADNCPDDSNPGQQDSDENGIGDACQLVCSPVCPPERSCTAGNLCVCNHDIDEDDICDEFDLDNDNDGTDDTEDNCPGVSNPSQEDTDGDGAGNVCDDCPYDPDDDADNDGYCADVDNCPDIYNPDQLSHDYDGTGDACDEDDDGDGHNDSVDNCPLDYNPTQSDIDTDGSGDVCDDDIDGDGVLNNDDSCPSDSNPGQNSLPPSDLALVALGLPSGSPSVYSIFTAEGGDPWGYSNLLSAAPGLSRGVKDIETGQFNDDNLDGVVDDLDNLDIAVMHGYDGFGSPTTVNAVTIALGNGSGGFSVSTMSLNGEGDSLAVADVSGDGAMDLIVNRFDIVPNQLDIYTGNNNGTFSYSTAISSVVQILDVQATDFNLDGKADLAVVNPSARSVQVYINQGGLTFNYINLWNLAAFTPFRILVDDLDGDSDPDIVVVDIDPAAIYPLQIIENQGVGSASFLRRSPIDVDFQVAGTVPGRVVAIDFDGGLDGNGNKDLVLRGRDSNELIIMHEYPGTDFSWYQGSLALKKQLPINSAGGSAGLEIIKADINQDPYLDFVTVLGDEAVFITSASNGSGPVGIEQECTATITTNCHYRRELPAGSTNYISFVDLVEGNFYGHVEDDPDGDGAGAVCDPNDADPYECGDQDGDSCDDCSVAGTRDLANDGTDTDGDGLCDAGDPCLNDPDNDLDHDGVCGDVDNCVMFINPGQEDCDSDGLGDACDPDDLPTVTVYLDSDGDGYGDPNTSELVCGEPAGYVTNGDDCDDSNAAIHPGAVEVCDGVDNDCNPATVDGVEDSCDDTVSCTVDSCQAGSCVHAVDHGACDDSLFCNGAETCDAILDCVAGPAPTDDDGLECTDEVCNEGTDTIDHIPGDDDADTVDDCVDNCPLDANTDQANNDGDELGDVCDPDDDNDAVLDTADNCQFTANGYCLGAESCDLNGDGAIDTTEYAACGVDLSVCDGNGDGALSATELLSINQKDTEGDGLGNACDPLTISDCSSAVPLIEWKTKGAEMSTATICSNLNQDAQSCYGLCEALRGLSEQMALSAGEVITDYCDYLAATIPECAAP